MSEKYYVGLDLTGFEDRGQTRPVSRVTLLVDDDTVVTAGDDTGLELTADCPHATQGMADAVLASLKGYRYKMYRAAAANLDPAAELGDGVTAGGIYSVISSITEDGTGYPDLEATGEAELEDEFPTEGPLTRTFNRKISDTRAAITKTAEEIRLEVTKGDESNKSYIDQTAESIRQEVSDTEEELQASIEVNAQAIEQRVTKNGVISAINQSAEEITIQAGKISLEGLVTVNKTFQIDKDGYLRCSGGTIGGFAIGQSALYNGLSSFSGTADGVYLGTDGISLGGGKFKVDSFGNLTASSGTFTGSVWAKNIMTGETEGYITGGQIGSGTVRGGNIAAKTLTGGDYGNLAMSTVTGGNLTTAYATQASFNTLSSQVGDFGKIFSGATLADRIHVNSLNANSAYIGNVGTLKRGSINYKDWNDEKKSAYFVTYE